MSDDKKLDPAEVLARVRAAAETGRIGYAGRDAEIAYLREALLTEPDPGIRARMQRRLEYVEARTDAQLHIELTGKAPS